MGNATAREFRTGITVRFQHTDPAGLVFYPRYFEMVNQVVEDWFDQCLGTSFYALHFENGRGVPTVHIEMEFQKPARLGDELEFTLRVRRVGKSSVGLEFTANNGVHECLHGHSTLVYVEAAGPKAVPWPDSLRERMSSFTDDATPS